MFKTFEEYRHFAWDAGNQEEAEVNGINFKIPSVAKDLDEPFFNKKKKEYKRSFVWSRIEPWGYITQYFKNKGFTKDDITDDNIINGMVDYIKNNLIGEKIKTMSTKVYKGKIVKSSTPWWIFTLKECDGTIFADSNKFISLIGEDGIEYIINANIFSRFLYVKKNLSGIDHSDIDPFGEENWFE